MTGSVNNSLTCKHVSSLFWFKSSETLSNLSAAAGGSVPMFAECVANLSSHVVLW